MTNEPVSASYKRQGNNGKLKLNGIIDIFEAASLHATACRALEDSKARVIQVNMADVERLDVTALQILLALRRDVEAADRSLTFDPFPEHISGQMKNAGIKL